jgi:hypothetical protein
MSRMVGGNYVSGTNGQSIYEIKVIVLNLQGNLLLQEGHVS